MEDTEIETKEAEARGKSENEKGQGVEDRSARFLTVSINLLDCARTFYLHKTQDTDTKTDVTSILWMRK